MRVYYYTTRGRQQAGPISADEVLALSREMGPDAPFDHATEIWREGYGAWVPLHSPQAMEDLALVAGGAIQSAGLGVCGHSGGLYPQDQLIESSGRRIHPDWLQAAAQQQLETGVNIPTAPTQVQTWAPTTDEVRYAGFWWRLLAYFIDASILGVVNMIGYFVFLASVFGSISISSLSEGGVNDGPPMGVIIGFIVYAFSAIGVPLFYFVWMVGKYQATLGKLAIGAKVVRANGERLGYGRAFLRYFCWGVSYFLASLLPLIVFYGGIGMTTGFEIFEKSSDELSSEEGLTIFLLVVGAMFSFLISAGVFWCCGLDKEKRTLHDRMASTRVIKTR